MKLKMLLLLLILWVTSSEGLFFNYPKNVLTNFFSSLREKKEMKKPPPIPDIHHYHLHYYPVHVQSIHTSLKSFKAPDKHELESIHTNKLENYGWSEQEYRYMQDPVYHHAPSFVDPWSMSESHVYHRPETVVEGVHDGEKSSHVDRYGEESAGKTSAGILVQVPLHQQIFIQQPVKTEKPKETHPLVAFLEKLRNFKNSIFHSSDKIEEKSDDFPDQLNAFVVFRNSKAKLLR